MTAQELKAAHLLPVQQLAHCSREPAPPKSSCRDAVAGAASTVGVSLQEQHPSPTVSAPQSFQHSQQQRKCRQYYMVRSGFCSCWQTRRSKGTFHKDRPQRSRNRDTPLTNLKEEESKTFCPVVTKYFPPLSIVWVCLSCPSAELNLLLPWSLFHLSAGTIPGVFCYWFGISIYSSADY